MREPIGVPSDLCLCGHLREDHQPNCIVVEYGMDCLCTDFAADEQDDEGYWFTDDEGRKVDGFQV
jgi:hypothetical protein